MRFTVSTKYSKCRYFVQQKENESFARYSSKQRRIDRTISVTRYEPENKHTAKRTMSPMGKSRVARHGRLAKCGISTGGMLPNGAQYRRANKSFSSNSGRPLEFPSFVHLSCTFQADTMLGRTNERTNERTRRFHRSARVTAKRLSRDTADPLEMAIARIKPSDGPRRSTKFSKL